jgi:hypothetical protein
LSSVSEDVIAAMQAEPYSPGQSKPFWDQYEPQMLEFLRELESREDWVSSGIGEAEPNLVKLITNLPRTDCMPQEGLVTLMRILSSLPYGESMHALLWLQVQNAPAVRDVLAYTFDHRKENAAANVMWQRLERVSRFHVLSGLVSDLSGAATMTFMPSHVDERKCDSKPANPRDQDQRELPHLLGSRRLIALLNEDTLPFLQDTRTISSLNEVDELFGNRRFYLLTHDMELCRSLAPHGVGVDQYGGYVTRGPACDFDRLDHLLPYVARRSIKPLFGDLIPYTSWASNLARLLTRQSWDRIRRSIIESTGMRCEICGAKDSTKEIDCHEQWEYHEPIQEGRCGVQRLVGLWAMCDECHATQHLGRSNSNGRGADALDRLRRIGRMSERETQAYRAFVFDRWERRSKIGWMLDVSSLAGPEPLVVQSTWTLDAQGFLNKDNQVTEGKKIQSKTVLLGAAWKFSAKDSTVYPARAVEDGYYE